MEDFIQNGDQETPSGRQSQHTNRSSLSSPAFHAGDDRRQSRIIDGDRPELTPPPTATVGRGLSLWMAAVFIVGEICGSGMLSLPYALTHTGWLGLPLILLIGLGSGYCASCLSRCWIIIESRNPELRGKHTQQPLSDIAFHSLGKPGRILAVTCMCCNTFGTCIVYVLLVAQMMQTLLAFIPMPYCAWIFVLAVLLVPPTWHGSPKDIRGLGVAALATTLLTWLLSVGQLAAHFDALQQNATFHEPDPLPFFLGIGPILYSYGGASALPTIQIDMLNRGHFTYSVLLGYFGCILLFVPLAGLGYGSSGDQVEKNILQTLKLHTPGLAPTAAELIFIVHLVAAFYVILNPFAQQMEALAGVPFKFGIKRVLFRTALMGLLVFLGETIPDFIQLIQLLGSTTVVTTAFILPGIMYLVLARKTDPTGRWVVVHVPIWEMCIMVLMTLIGVMVGVTSTVMSLKQVIRFGLSSSCLIRT